MHTQKRKLPSDKAIMARIKRFEYALSAAEGCSRQSILERIEGCDVIMCEGSRAKCQKFYKDNQKRSKVELHFGYDCGPIDDLEKIE